MATKQNHQHTAPNYQHGIRFNIVQFTHQLFQVFLVGMMLGMTRTVVPALADSEFGVAPDSFTILTAFVVAFGFVKGSLNFVAGRVSESIGRKPVLLIGWLIALPVPIMIFYAPNWNWIVAATVLLGVNQGLCWSMTQTSKIDLSHPNQRGLSIGLNEFAGYFGVAAAGIITGYLAEILAPREALLFFGMVIAGMAVLITLIWVQDTMAWMRLEANTYQPTPNSSEYPQISGMPTTWEVFTLVSWRDRRLFAFSQAGLVEKFVDVLVWVFYPVYLYQQGLSLSLIGWVVGVYGFVWGISQFATGKLSDYIGRIRPIIAGMWVCGIGVAMTLLDEGIVWWSLSAAVTGIGMALLYPNLSAAVSDLAHPIWRGSAIGCYRFWRDLGYGIGALILGLATDIGDVISVAFWVVTWAMGISGLLVWYYGEETLPKLQRRNLAS